MGARSHRRAQTLVSDANRTLCAPGYQYGALLTSTLACVYARRSLPWPPWRGSRTRRVATVVGPCRTRLPRHSRPLRAVAWAGSDRPRSSPAPDGSHRTRPDSAMPVSMFESRSTSSAWARLRTAARHPAHPDLRGGRLRARRRLLVGPAASGARLTSPINSGPQQGGPGLARCLHQMGQPVWAAAAMASALPSGLHLPGVTGARHLGNVIGGVRTPAVDVPVSTLSSAAPAGTSDLRAVRLDHCRSARARWCALPQPEPLPGRLPGRSGPVHSVGGSSCLRSARAVAKPQPGAFPSSRRGPPPQPHRGRPFVVPGSLRSDRARTAHAGRGRRGMGPAPLGGPA